jgi:hypothetical protein
MLVFIDESGFPHPNDPIENPTLVAVCLSEAYHRTLNSQLYSLKRRLLSNPEEELKATKLLRRRVFEEMPKLREFTESVFDLIRTTDLAIFGMIMKRPSRPQNVPEGILPNQYVFLLERVNFHALAVAPEDDRAILIVDGQGSTGIPGGLASGISRFLFRHRMGMSWYKILDTPLFVDSKFTPGIQIADMIAGCLRIYQCKKLFREENITDVFCSAIQRYYEIIKSKTRNFEADGITYYGLYQMTEDHLLYKDEHLDKAAL